MSLCSARGFSVELILLLLLLERRAAKTEEAAARGEAEPEQADDGGGWSFGLGWLRRSSETVSSPSSYLDAFLANCLTTLQEKGRWTNEYAARLAHRDGEDGETTVCVCDQLDDFFPPPRPGMPRAAPTLATSLITRGGGVPLAEAGARGNVELVSFWLAATAALAADASTASLAAAAPAVAALPDFDLQLEWHLSSWVPLLSRWMPTDTWTLHKRGSAIRIDMTLLGFGSLRTGWRRGRASLFLDVATQAMSMVHWDDRLVVMEARRSTGPRIATKGAWEPLWRREAEKFIREGTFRSGGLYADACAFRPRMSWLGWGSDPIVEQVGPYQAHVYDLSDMILETWERRRGDAPPEPTITDVTSELQRALREEEEQAAGGTREDIALDDEDDEEGDDGDDGEGDDERQLIDRRQGRRRRRGGRNGRNTDEPFDESLYRVDRDAFDTIAFATGALPDSTAQAIVVEGEKLIHKRKAYSGTVWLSPDFPRTVDDLRPIFAALSPTSDHAQRLSDFLDLRFPSDGFPVKVVLPVVPTVSAQVEFLSYTEKNLTPNVTFDVPADFQRAAPHQRRHQ